MMYLFDYEQQGTRAKVSFPDLCLHTFCSNYNPFLSLSLSPSPLSSLLWISSFLERQSRLSTDPPLTMELPNCETL